MSKSILILDQNTEASDLLRVVLESTDFGYQCDHAESLEQLGDILKVKKVDVVLIDKDLPDEGLLKKIKKCKMENREVRMIMLADELEEKEALKAREYYIEGFCQKTEDYPTLINTIEQVVD